MTSRIVRNFGLQLIAKTFVESGGLETRGEKKHLRTTSVLRFLLCGERQRAADALASLCPVHSSGTSGAVD
jgi:hypothetical protein